MLESIRQRLLWFCRSHLVSRRAGLGPELSEHQPASSCISFCPAPRFRKVRLRYPGGGGGRVSQSRAGSPAGFCAAQNQLNAFWASQTTFLCFVILHFTAKPYWTWAGSVIRSRLHVCIILDKFCIHKSNRKLFFFNLIELNCWLNKLPVVTQDLPTQVRRKNTKALSLPLQLVVQLCVGSAALPHIQLTPLLLPQKGWGAKGEADTSVVMW